MRPSTAATMDVTTRLSRKAYSLDPNVPDHSNDARSRMGNAVTAFGGVYEGWA
ncbi:hypothetical protein [Arthrobacter sp. M4]|uniref:hypothetical protein n=1 Tax=Arthrobacter sp. M4 TaxID=218160 RepID=UPI001CDBC9AE|nr:hypothetical protein [Arthrobacter sp. M4]MCA4131286.1 hypothetical protein [Arthrobacter sp. M4]